MDPVADLVLFEIHDICTAFQVHYTIYRHLSQPFSSSNFATSKKKDLALQGAKAIGSDDPLSYHVKVPSEAGTNAFVLSPQKWIDSTNAIGLISKSGRGGGTYAHKDIAFEFASWISVEFKLYIIKDYQRLKADENSRISLDWNVKRILAKVNYRIHTDAIRDNLIPLELTPRQRSFVYADEFEITIRTLTSCDSILTLTPENGNSPREALRLLPPGV